MWQILLISKLILFNVAGFTPVLYLPSNDGFYNILKDSCQKVYIVNKVRKAPEIDGIKEDNLWGKANLMEDLDLHWEGNVAQPTKYRALYDSTYFYFLFEVQDADIVIWDTIENELDVIWEDRVEMFFTPDRKFNTYFCLEIDPYGRYLSNSGSLGKKIDISWECEGCKFVGKKYTSGYTLEGAIPIITLKKMGVYDEKSIMNAGVYRADFNHTGKPKEPEMHWISWIKSDSPKPNFHIPSSLGCFEFEK